MLRWFSPRYWQRYAARVRRREQLALLLWPYLPVALRTADETLPLSQVSTVVAALEEGRDDFRSDVGLDALWQAAMTDNEVQQAAGALRTLKLQAEGDSTAAGLEVAPLSRRTMRDLRKRMMADAVYSEIDWQLAPVLLPLVSALLLLSGWFFNAIYLGRLGLSVGKYFGLSDYLAASMEGLLPAVGGVLFTLSIQWLVRGRLRLQHLQRLLGMQWSKQITSLLTFVIAAIITPYIVDDPNAMRVTYVYLVATGLTIGFVPLAASYSKRPARDSMLMNFIAIYCAVLWFSAEMRYIDTLTPKPNRTEIVLTTAPDTVLNWRVLSGNSLYLFLQNEKKEMIVVPVQQVMSVRYRQQEAEPALELQSTPAPAAATTPTAK